MAQLFEYRLQQMTSFALSRLFIIVTFAIMQISIYRDYSENSQVPEKQLLDILKYLDILYLLKSSSVGIYVQICTAILTIPIPVLCLMIFIQKRMDQFSQPFNQFHGQAVLFLIQLYIWVLFYPYFQILFMQMPCNHALMDCTQYDIYYIAILLLNTLCLLFMITIAIMSPFFQNDQFQKKDFLNIDNSYGFLVFNFYRIILAVAHNLDSTQLITLIPQVFLVIYLYSLHNNGSFIVYQQQNMFNFLLQQQISLYIACYLTELTKLLIGRNYNESIYYVILCSLLNIHVYRSQQERKLINLFKQTDTFSSIKRKINLFSFYLRDYSISQSTRQTICWGLIVNHLQNKCSFIMNQKIQFNCFCNQRIIYFAKKRQDCSTNQRQLYLNYIQYFNFICKIWLEEYLQKNPQNNEAQVFYAKYLFHKLNLIQQSIIVMQKLNTYNPYLKYDGLILIEKIKIQQDQSNFNSYIQKLQFEDVLKVEQAIYNIQQFVIDIINLNVKFWKMFLRPIVYENDIIKTNLLIQSKIQKCEQLWDGILYRKVIQNNNLYTYSYLNKHYKWLFQFCWYQLYILNKSTKQQLLDQLPNQTPKIEQLMKDESVSEDSENERDYFFKLNKNKPFSDQTAIVHTNCDKELMVQQVNNSFQSMFGYKKQEIIQKPINLLLPNILIRNHQIFVKNFIHKGKDSSLYSKKIIFALDKFGYLMQCSKYLKFIINPQHQIEFICMIRQIKTQSYIVLLNLDWEIESISQQLQDLEILQKVSLLIVCPKLLQYSTYQNYLQVQDLDNFELNMKRQSKLMIGDRRYTYTRRAETIQEIYQNPASLIFKQNDGTSQDSSDSETSIIDQLLMEEQTVRTQKKKKFHHIVNANHVQLNFRIPKNIYELIDLYQKQKKDLIGQQLPYIHQRLIDRDENNKLFLHKNRLLRQIRIQKQQYYEQMLDNFRFLYNKYLRRKQGIKQIIKLDVNIQFPQNKCFDKYIVLVVNKIETHQNRQRKQDIIQSRKFVQNEILNQSSSQQIININSIDFNSNRTYNTKPLLTDILLADEIQFQEPVLSLKTSDNIFIKKENNKPQKYLRTLRIFNIISRLFLFLYFISVIIMYLVGYNLQIDRAIKEQGIQQLNLNTQILRSISKTHDYTLELSLFNQNITSEIILDSQNTPFRTRQEYIIFLKNEIKKIYKFLYFIYLDQNFIKTYYMKSTNFNTTLNALDLFSQYQNNLVQVYLSDPTQIDDQFVNLVYFRRQTYPQLFSTFVDTKDNLIIFIKNQLVLEQRTIIYFLTVGIVIAIISLLSSVVILKNIHNKLMVIFNQQVRIEKKSIYEIINYFVSLSVNFNYFINFKNEDQRFNDVCIQQVNEINELKLAQNKSSQFIQSQQWKNKKIKSIFFYCLFFSIIIGMPIFYNLYIVISITELQYFITRNIFINNYDQFFILTALKECYLSKYKNSEINSDYEIFLQNYIINIQDVDQSIYQTTLTQIEQVLDGDVCDYLQNDSNFTSIDIQYCQQLLDGALSRGIKQYDYLLSQQIMSLLNNDTRFENISFTSLQQFTILQNYVFAGLQKALNIWQQEYNIKADQLSKFEIILMILSLINMIFHYIILENIIFKQLNDEYRLAKQFYKRFMPTDVINFQKLIRVELIRSDLLKR